MFTTFPPRKEGKDWVLVPALSRVSRVNSRVFRAEKRSAQSSAQPLSQAQGGNFLCVDCVCL